MQLGQVFPAGLRARHAVNLVRGKRQSALASRVSANVCNSQSSPSAASRVQSNIAQEEHSGAVMCVHVQGDVISLGVHVCASVAGCTTHATSMGFAVIVIF